MSFKNRVNKVAQQLSNNNLDGLFSDHGGLTSDEMDIPIIFYNT